MEQPELLRMAAWAFWAVLWGACSLLVATWRLYLTNRYLREALEREMRSCSDEKRKLIEFYFRRCNAMQKTLLESFLRDPQRTLNDLVDRTEHEWSLRQSERLSQYRSRQRDWRDDHDETIQLTTRDLTER